MCHVILTTPTRGTVLLVVKRLILHVAHSCTEFEVSSCSRCTDISGDVKFALLKLRLYCAIQICLFLFLIILKCATWPWPRPFYGWLDVSRLGLAATNLQTKFDVSNYTHYEDMRSCAKYTNWGSLGRLWVTEGHRQCHHSIERIWLPIRL